MSKRTIFISYSHEDEAWTKRLVKHLKALEKENIFSVWYDRKIETGTNWEKEITTAIREAHVAVLLVTPAFLASDFINKVEIPLILEQREMGLRVLPVIAGPCAWESISWLSAIQLASKDGKPLSGRSNHEIEEELVTLTNKIGKLNKGFVWGPLSDSQIISIIYSLNW